MSVGSFISDITGTDHSARKNFNYSMRLQQQNQAWQTEMANTAHQREVQDLKAAGLNPILSAGGSGADTGSPGGGSVSGTQAGDPISMLGNIVNSIATIKQTENNTAKTNADIQNETAITEAEIAKKIAETRNISTRTPQMENDERFAKTWWGRNISPIIRDIFGGSSGGIASGAIAGAAVSQAATSAKKAKTPKRNKIGF